MMRKRWVTFGGQPAFCRILIDGDGQLWLVTYTCPMSKEGPEFFDDPDVFQQYLRHRESRDNPNDTMENPVILDLLGAVGGARILDLGCGDG